MKKSRSTQPGDFIIHNSARGCFHIVASDGKCLVFFPGDFEISCRVTKQSDALNVAKMIAAAADLQGANKIEIGKLKLANTAEFFGGINILQDVKYDVFQLY